jgi:peptide/nickel transport system permease protein
MSAAAHPARVPLAWPRRWSWRRVVLAAFGLVLLAVVAFPGLFTSDDWTTVNVADKFLGPSAAHPFGTDEAGRDILARIVHGARLSIGSALAVAGLAAAVGTLYGAISGWVGGWADRILMRIVDVLLAFPYLVLAMALAAAIGRDLRSAVIALTIVWWPSYARMVRGLVLSLKRDLHVRAARTLGASSAQLLRWHVVPHTFRELNARLTVDVGYALVALTGLSFLGLGAQGSSPEWGLMVSTAKGFVLTAWWYALFPGLVILLTVLYFVRLGDELSGEAA